MSVIATVALVMTSYQKRNQLLMDLGLIRKWTGEELNPFYKWGWRKASGERVWGERIVREAFNKAKIWLNPEDLLFFKQKCDENESGNKVDPEKVRERVAKIVKRMDAMNTSINKLVSNTIHKIISIGNPEAEKILREQGITAEKDMVRHRFGTWEIRRVMTEAGKQVLVSGSKGFLMESNSGEYSFHLKGFEGWQQWLVMYKKALDTQLSRNVLPNHQPILRSLRASVREGLLKDYEDDIHESQSFRHAIEQEINRKEISLSPNDAEEIETVFYTWQFSNRISFNLVDHKKARTLLTDKKMMTRFRQLIFSSLENDFNSLKEFLKKFQRYVIFYGKSGYARAFASDQYLKHLTRLLEVFSIPAGENPTPPALLTILDEEVESAREATSDQSSLPVFLQKKKKKEAPPEMYISWLIERKKEENMKERNLTYTDADKNGWIINLPLDDSNYPEEFRELEIQPYRSYNRFPCDEFGQIDYVSQSFHARNQRILFFNQILDTLISTPPITQQNDTSFTTSIHKTENKPVGATA